MADKLGVQSAVNIVSALHTARKFFAFYTNFMKLKQKKNDS